MFYIGYWKLILEIREWIWVLIYFFFSYILNKYKNLFVFCYCIWFRKRDVCFILFLLIVFLLNFFYFMGKKVCFYVNVDLNILICNIFVVNDFGYWDL